jgi:hypothetical protein
MTADERPGRYAVVAGIFVGSLIVAATGFLYLVVLREPGGLFYVFAALIFIGGPVIAGLVALRRSRDNGEPRRVFVRAGAAVFGLAILGFIATYAVSPALERTSVALPEFCGEHAGTRFEERFVYQAPGIGPTVLVASDADSMVVTSVELAQPPFASAAYLLRRSDNRVLWSERFANDTIAASIEAGVLYLYNDKIGYWIDARSGLRERELFTIDNYGGLSRGDRPVMASRDTGGGRFFETSAVISSWGLDGRVAPRRRLTFNGIAMNCFVWGQNGTIARLWK